MKNKKRIIFLILGIALIVFIALFFIYYYHESSLLDSSDKKWISENGKKVIDIEVFNDVSVFGMNGKGVIFDFLDYVTEETELQFNKIPYSKDLMIDGKFTVECGYHSAPLLLERGATAIFAHNDMIALGVYHYLREHHIRIPEDVSLVGFDGVPIISSLELPLTTVVQPIPSIAERSIDILMDSLQNPTADRIAITLQPELVIRSTTGPVRSL